MKKLSFILLVVAFAISSCKKEKKASITAKILNSDLEYVMLKSTENEDAIADTSFVDSSNTIKFVLQIEEPGFYLLRMRNQLIMELFISPGDELSFTLDMDKPFDQIEFVGKGEKVNNYLFKHLMSDEYLLPGRDVLFRMEEKEFISTVEKAYDTKLKNLDTFYNDHKKEVDKKFYDVYSTNLLYELAMNMISYKQRYPYYSEQPDYVFSADFDNYLKRLDLTNAENLRCNTYRLFLIRYVDLLADPIFTNDTLAQQSESGYSKIRYEIAKKAYGNADVLNYVLYQVMLEQVKYYGIKDISDLMSMFKNDCKNTEFVKNVETEVSKWDLILPGKIAPDFNYPDLQGKVVSLSQQKGKIVYIDVWATWCGPCRRESPYFHELAKFYQGKDIVFMQVSVDDEKSDYLDYMKEIPENTIQLYAGGWRSSITKDYLINSIPRFLIIGRDGKIVDNNAKRPSDNDIKNYLDALLTVN